MRRAHRLLCATAATPATSKVAVQGDVTSCHGRTSEILLDGQVVTTYHYDATMEYPYTLGCHHGTHAAVGPPGD